MTDKEGNDHLKRVMAEAACSYEGLARRVNMIGMSYGLALTYDKSSVSYWVKGKVPRGNVPLMIAEALSSKLGRVVTLAEIGFSEEPQLDLASRSLNQQEDMTATLAVTEKLGQADMERREFIYLLPFSAGAILGPQRDWLLHLLADRDSHPRAINKQQVESMRLMMNLFIEADNQFGGKHARSALASYLTNDVIPMLRSHATDDTRQDLFTAAAELCMTLGWMTYDVGACGLAQRYLTQGMFLAREGGSQGLAIGSNILSALSHISVFTGHAREGVNLAQIAAHTAERSSSPASLTRALAMEARAHATLRDSRSAVAAMSKAEKARALPGDDPAWMAFLDENYLANQFAYCCREIGETANMLNFATNSLRGSTGRQVVSNETYIAWAQLNHGDVEGACQTGLKSAEHAAALKSRMVGRLVRDLIEKLAASKYKSEPYAEDFLRQAANILA